MADQTTPAHPAAMEAQINTTTITAESPLPTPFVTTERLIIRQMHPSDAASMSLHANDPLVTRNMSLAFPEPYTLEQANIWINMNMNIPQIDNWCICERNAPELVIGGMGLKPGADVHSHTAEVGYWLGAKFWGKGYMTEALEGLTEWCFYGRNVEGKALRKLCGTAYHTNIGSMRCFEKCGYTKEGIQRAQCEKYGEVMDLHLFGMTKKDWEERREKKKHTT